jgi:hypothetical protein
MSSMQGDIFQSFGQRDLPTGAFPEVCTALYERELASLAYTEMSSLNALQRRLASTSYYVKQAARAMLEQPIPLQLDIQNASWQAAQKRQLTHSNSQPQKLQQWLQRQARLGAVVPVFDLQPRLQRVLLDSIDRLDVQQQRVHLNMHGWFDWQGHCLEPKAEHIRLVRPDTQTLVPALCGHQWNHRGRIDPRTLSLREVLLATSFDWR